MSYQVKIRGKGVPSEEKNFETEKGAKEYVDGITSNDTPGWEDRGDEQVLVDLNNGHTPFVHYLTEE